MRSVYAKVLLLSFGILIFSLGGFLVISRTMTYRSFGKQTPVGRNAAMQFEEARLEYETGGAKALSSYLGWQHAFYPKLQFYFARKGRDLVTGEDRSQLLARAKSRWALLTVASPIVVAVPSADSEDAFLIDIPPQDVMLYLPYYLLLLGAITILCWGLALQFASPLNRLTETVRGFGIGSLSARVNSRRHDEIGDVARAFDQMADRIESLLTAERRLLQDISHELRSPLARLSFAAELTRTSADREAAAMRVTREVDRLSDLVGKLLEVTRPAGDQSARDLGNVALDGLLRELVLDCEIEAAARGCQLILNGSNPLELKADRELLRRAIENIFRNAIRHAPPGSSIEITVNSEAGNASVSVRDYGCGVPAEALQKIFQPFFRVDNSRDTTTGGVGLGLAIAKRAIQVHRGHIWAENAEPGLRVFVDLPLTG
jgi:signal transduction histidine kinase